MPGSRTRGVSGTPWLAGVALFGLAIAGVAAVVWGLRSPSGAAPSVAVVDAPPPAVRDGGAQPGAVGGGTTGVVTGAATESAAAATATAATTPTTTEASTGPAPTAVALAGPGFQPPTPDALRPDPKLPERPDLRVLPQVPPKAAPKASPRATPKAAPKRRTARSSRPAAPEPSAGTTPATPRGQARAGGQAPTRNAAAPRTPPPPGIHPAPAEPSVSSIADLPGDVRSRLPRVSLAGGMYSSEPAQRLVVVGGQVAREGDQPLPGVTLVQIRPRSAVFEFEGRRFEVPQ